MVILVYGTTLSLFLSYLVVFTTASSQQTIEVIRNAGKADVFSLPEGACFPRYCRRHAASCDDGKCCKCKCDSSNANYIVNQKECVSREELNEMNSTKCEYSMRNTGTPLVTLPLTKEMETNWTFTDTDDHRTLIDCSEDIKVGRWEYRDAFGKWKKGDENIFEVKGYEQPGHPRNQRVLQYLEWRGKLHSKYGGMLIRFILTCQEQDKGCFLSKISGSHTYNTTPQPVISTPTTTIPTTTNPPTTNEDNHYDQQKAKGNPKANAGSQRSDGDAAAIFGPVLGVLGLICIIGLVCVVAARYRKMKRRQKDPENNSTITLDEYKDPIYDNIDNMNFDNPVYNDPTLDRSNLKAHLGPLPAIPGSWSTYQALNNMTRNSGYDNPPVSMKSTDDYDNPPVKDDMESTEDYDNPIVKDDMKSTEDYDNPIVKDDMKSTEDYDNPPLYSETNNTNDDDKPPANNGNDTPQSEQTNSGEDTFF